MGKRKGMYKLIREIFAQPNGSCASGYEWKYQQLLTLFSVTEAPPKQNKTKPKASE